MPSVITSVNRSVSSHTSLKRMPKSSRVSRSSQEQKKPPASQSKSTRLILGSFLKGQVILLDAISGEFAGINFITPQYYLSQPFEQDVSQDELDAIKEKAITELGKYIDLSKYEKEEYILDTYVDNKPSTTPIIFYKVHYYKVIDGFVTTEEANIVYDSKGNIIEISMVDKGLFDDLSIANRVTSIDKTKMNSDLDSKVESVCKSIDINEYTYEVEKSVVSTDDSGSPILLVYLNITYSNGLTGKIVLARNI